MSKLKVHHLHKAAYDSILKGERFTFSSKTQFDKGDFLLLHPMDSNGVIDETKMIIVKVLYSDVLKVSNLQLFVIAVDIKKGFKFDT